MKKIIMLIAFMAVAVFAQGRWTLLARWDTTDADNVYIGKVAADNPNNPVDEVAARWQIKKITTNGVFYSRSTTNANDGVTFNKVWTNRAAYVYTDME
jgi:hypothetical protein